MDLKSMLQTLCGQPLNVGGRVYSRWRDDVLCDVLEEDARELLSLPNHFQPVRRRTSPRQTPKSQKSPVPQDVAPNPTLSSPVPAPVTDDLRAAEMRSLDDDRDADGEREYTEADLEKMTVVDLLEFVPRSQHAEASRLRKRQLIDYILQLHSGRAEEGTR